MSVIGTIPAESLIYGIPEYVFWQPSQRTMVHTIRKSYGYETSERAMVHTIPKSYGYETCIMCICMIFYLQTW